MKQCLAMEMANTYFTTETIEIELRTKKKNQMRLIEKYRDSYVGIL